MTDKETDQMKVLAQDYNSPDDVPRETMWVAITAERAKRKEHSTRRIEWKRQTMAIAALLLLGIAIGRFALAGRSVSDPGTNSEAAFDEGFRRGLYASAAIDHIRETEEFLMLFRSDLAAGIIPATASGNAQDLLSTTRLFLDMTDLDDLEISDLFEDLELVLSQIAQYSETRIRELQYIADGLDQTDVLHRLRSLIRPGEIATQL